MPAEGTTCDAPAALGQGQAAGEARLKGIQAGRQVFQGWLSGMKEKLQDLRMQAMLDAGHDPYIGRKNFHGYLRRTLELERVMLTAAQVAYFHHTALQDVIPGRPMEQFRWDVRVFKALKAEALQGQRRRW